MKPSIFFFVALSAIASWGGSASPQGPKDPAAPLLLQEAIDQALERNRDLKVARTDIEVSRGKLRQARTYPFNPDLVLEGDFGRGLGREVNPERRGLWGSRVGLAQVVEIRGQKSLRTRAAQSDATRTEWEVRDSEREIVAATMRAFSNLLLAQERVDLAREVESYFARVKETARELASSGSVPELDVLRAEVERRRAANRLVLEEAAAAEAGRTLALLTGMPQAQRVRAAGPLMFEPVTGERKDLIEGARSHRPDLKAAEAALQSAAASLSLIRAERVLPSFTLSASYVRNADYDAYNDRGVLGISVPLPIVNRRGGEISAAEALVRKAEAQRQVLLARMEKEVLSAYDELLAARQVVGEFASRIIPEQEQNFRLIEEGYRMGEFRLTDVLLAQRDSFETRSGYLEALGLYNRALAEMVWALGVRP